MDHPFHNQKARRTAYEVAAGLFDPDSDDESTQKWQVEPVADGLAPRDLSHHRGHVTFTQGSHGVDQSMTYEWCELV